MGAIIISSGNTYMVTKNGSAAIRNTAVDITQYLGGAITVADSAGETATGVIGAADTAEALGSDLLTNGTFEGVYVAGVAPGWTFYGTGTPTENNATKHGGAVSQKIDNGAADAGYLRQESVNIEDGYLYKIGGFAYPDGDYGIVFWVRYTGATNPYYIQNLTVVTSGSWNEIVDYFTAFDSDATARVYIGRTSTGACITLYDDYYIKKVTHLGADAVTIDGGNWTLSDPAFDPNDVATITIIPASTGRVQQTVYNPISSPFNSPFELM